jgi:hypothetical protein
MWLMTEGLEALRNYALFAPLMLIALVVLVAALFFVLGYIVKRSRPATPDCSSLRGSVTAPNERTTAQQSSDLLLGDWRR